MDRWTDGQSVVSASTADKNALTKMAGTTRERLRIMENYTMKTTHLTTTAVPLCKGVTSASDITIVTGDFIAKVGHEKKKEEQSGNVD